MNSTLRMNNFLQRMLKKSDDESDGDTVTYDSARQRVECSPRSGKSNWMRKLGAYSPSRQSPSRPITPKPAGHRRDYRRRIVPESPAASVESVTNSAMPDLEKIIHEFEEGFLSPTKHETHETVKSGRFVKQIVAAFEEKYKERNDYKMLSERSSCEPIANEDETDETTLGVDTTTVEISTTESANHLSRTYVIDSLENRLSVYRDIDVRSSSSSGVSDDSVDLCTFAMDEELATSSTPAKKLTDPFRRSPIVADDRQPIDDSPKIVARSKPLLRSNSSLRRERQPTIVGAFLKKPIEVEDTSIDWIPITGKKLPRKKSFKRLLSVLTGKKSSEKSSKLYCSQANLQEENGGRELLHDSGYDEKSCSSSSLASLVSITDLFLQHQQHQDNYNYHIANFHQSRPIDDFSNAGNPSFTTFRQSPPVGVSAQPRLRSADYPEPDVELADDAYSDTCSVASSTRKLLLEEVPRSEVRLSLGPSFPSGPRFIESQEADAVENAYSAICRRDGSDGSSYDEPSYETLPPASPLPKHPFVSASTGGDKRGAVIGPRRKAVSQPEGRREKRKEEKYVANLGAFEAGNGGKFNCLDEYENIELRRNFRPWTFPSSDTVTYDVPRRYMSKSEPGLATYGRERNEKMAADEVVYDVPRPEVAPRPRSSVYEDALSLKRRNEHLACYSPPASGFYAFPSHEEPHYATVKPRNTRICPSRELMRSAGDLSGRCDDFYGRRRFDGVRNF